MAAAMAFLAFLLLGLGAASTAFACPVTAAASAATAPAMPDDCGHEALDACVTACASLCQTLLPDASSRAAASCPNSDFRMWIDEAVKLKAFAPEPPPPRTG